MPYRLRSDGGCAKGLLKSSDVACHPLFRSVQALIRCYWYLLLTLVRRVDVCMDMHI